MHSLQKKTIDGETKEGKNKENSKRKERKKKGKNDKRMEDEFQLKEYLIKNHFDSVTTSLSLFKDDALCSEPGTGGLLSAGGRVGV